MLQEMEIPILKGSRVVSVTLRPDEKKKQFEGHLLYVEEFVAHPKASAGGAGDS